MAIGSARRPSASNKMKLEFMPISHVPEIQSGANLPDCLLDAIRRSGIQLYRQDIVAVTQKIISKAEGRVVHLATVEPTAHSAAIARRMKKDARLIELILRESRRVVRMR